MKKEIIRVHCTVSNMPRQGVSVGVDAMTTEIPDKTAQQGAKLTPTEITVIRLIWEIGNASQVASNLCVSKRTVDFHMNNIMRKFNVSSRTVACRIALERGYISMPETSAESKTGRRA